MRTRWRNVAYALLLLALAGAAYLAGALSGLRFPFLYPLIFLLGIGLLVLDLALLALAIAKKVSPKFIVAPLILQSIYYGEAYNVASMYWPGVKAGPFFEFLPFVFHNGAQAISNPADRANFITSIPLYGGAAITLAFGLLTAVWLSLRHRTGDTRPPQSPVPAGL